MNKVKPSVIYLNEVPLVAHKSLSQVSGQGKTPQPDPLNELFQSIVEQDYLSTFGLGFAVPTCKVYTFLEVFKYNILFWTLPFFFGLNFTHLDKGPLNKFSLDPKDMKTWGIGLWILFICMILLLGFIVTLIFSAYYAMGILSYYIAYAIALFTLMAWKTKIAKSKGKNIHIHHYTLALILMSFNSIQNPYLTVVHGFLHGMFIEGSCRWGLDAIWTYDEPSDEVTHQQNLNLLRFKQSQVRQANYAGPTEDVTVIEAVAKKVDPEFNYGYI